MKEKSMNIVPNHPLIICVKSGFCPLLYSKYQVKNILLQKSI